MYIDYVLYVCKTKPASVNLCLIINGDPKVVYIVSKVVLTLHLLKCVIEFCNVQNCIAGGDV
jgi:hypothetical protein